MFSNVGEVVGLCTREGVRRKVLSLYFSEVILSLGAGRKASFD